MSEVSRKYFRNYFYATIFCRFVFSETPYSKSDLVDDRACKGLRADLKLCLLQSDCCRVVRIWPDYLISQFHTVSTNVRYRQQALKFSHDPFSLQERLTPRQCLQQGKAPDACVNLHHSFMRCKMSMVHIFLNQLFPNELLKSSWILMWVFLLDSAGWPEITDAWKKRQLICSIFIAESYFLKCKLVVLDL